MMVVVIGAFLCCLSIASSSSSAEAGPSFLDVPTNVTVREGETIQLQCMVQNLSRHKVAWIRLKNSGILSIGTHLITRDYRVTATHENDTVWTLRITGALKRDAGWYFCQINTDPLMAQKHYVNVVDPPRVAEHDVSRELKPPVFTSRLQNVTAEPGDNVSFSCRVDHIGDFKVTWLFKDQQGVLFMGHQRWTHDNRFWVVSRDLDLTWELHIREVQPRDTGVYACAIAAKPSWIVQNGYLNVTLNETLPISFKGMLGDIQVTQGDTASLTCTVDNLGNYKVSWINVSSREILSVGHTLLTSDPRFDLLTNDQKWTLQIRNVQQRDSGVYKCQINTQPQVDQIGSLVVHKQVTTRAPVHEGQRSNTNRLATTTVMILIAVISSHVL